MFISKVEQTKNQIQVLLSKSRAYLHQHFMSNFGEKFGYSSEYTTTMYVKCATHTLFDRWDLQGRGGQERGERELERRRVEVKDS